MEEADEDNLFSVERGRKGDMIAPVIVQAIQRVESRKDSIGRGMEHIRHMVAGEDWTMAKDYAKELIVLLDEQIGDSDFVQRNMVEP